MTTLYLPYNLDHTIIQKIAKELHIHEDCVLMFISEVINARCRAKKKEMKDPDHWHPIKRDYLWPKIHYWSKVCTLVKKDLIISGIIECDEKYCPKEKCQWYRLGHQHRGVRIVSRQATNKRIQKQLNQIKAVKINSDREIEQIIFDNLTQIEIDYDKAYEYLQSCKVKNDDLKYLAIEKLKNKDWYFTGDEQGRIHNNITNLWSNIKDFLRYQGESLVSSDIRNSQPLLSTIPILLYFNAQEISRDKLEPDIQKFIQLTEKGELYDYLIKETKYRSSRKNFKHKFFAEIFYANCSRQTKLATLFSNLFPNVYEIICHFKKDGHREFALEMQRAESKLMIDNVAVKLAKEGIYFLTIHDNILTLERDKYKVDEIIKDEFSKIGLSPTINNE